MRNGLKQFSTPGKKRNKKATKTDLPEYQKLDVRDMIYNFHTTEGSRLTIKKLQIKMQAELDWQGSVTSVNKIVHNLGFRWRKTANNRKILIEKSDLRAFRISYISRIRLFRSQSRPIVYLDETYIHSTHVPSRSWSDDSGKGLTSSISKGQRLIIIHAGGETGFIPNALLIFKSGTKSGDYHSEMNSENYEKWLREKLIPNLPEHSLVVVDNAPYHSVRVNPAPNSNSKKCDMMRWLTEKGILFSPTMLKPELYQLIKQNKKMHIQ